MTASKLRGALALTLGLGLTLALALATLSREGVPTGVSAPLAPARRAVPHPFATRHPRQLRRRSLRAAPGALAPIAPRPSAVISRNTKAMAFDPSIISGAASKLEVIVEPLLSLAIDKVSSYVVNPVSKTLSSEVAGELGVYFSKTVIAWGVPTAAIGTLLILAAPKPKLDVDIDGGDETPSSPFAFLNKQKSKEPVQYLKIQRLNDKLESFDFSLNKATQSAYKATIERRKKIFERKYGQNIMSKLSAEQMEKILKADAKYRKASAKLQEQLSQMTKGMRTLAAKAGAKGGDMKMMMEAMSASQKINTLSMKQSKALAAYNQAEQKYIKTVSAELDEETRKEFISLLKKNEVVWQDGISSLSVTDENIGTKSHVFVLNFPGDVTASQVKTLRQEVTAVIRSANTTRGDEVVLVLNTGGGTVTGYGLAAAQLTRLKDAGLNLTICVEQVAASGGYMMACCADRLVSSPFAVLGSIGVITQQPNVYERLNREGVEFLTVTAGKYKRTLTPFKKPTDEDFAKTEEDLESIWTLFKDFVQTQRPKLDVPAVATGETWFGKDALERNLVDELKTTDEILLEKLDEGSEIYSVRYADPSSSPLGQLLPAASETSFLDTIGGNRLPAVRQKLLQWLVGDELTSLLNSRSPSSSISSETKRMIVDKTADNTFFMDE